MKWLKPYDFIRWILYIILFYNVYIETGFATLCFCFLVAVTMELDTFQNRIESEWRKAVKEGITTVQKFIIKIYGNKE